MSSSVPRQSALNHDMGHRPASQATSASRATAAEKAGFAPTTSRPSGVTHSSDPRRAPLLAEVTDLEPHWATAIDAATD